MFLNSFPLSVGSRSKTSHTNTHANSHANNSNIRARISTTRSLEHFTNFRRPSCIKQLYAVSGLISVIALGFRALEFTALVSVKVWPSQKRRKFKIKGGRA